MSTPSHQNNLAAYIGIAGALGMALCDMILLGQPVSGSAYDIASFGAMPYISALRAHLGATVGLICAFLICFGFWHVYQLFKPVNERLAWVMLVAFCSLQFFGGAFHAGYYFISGSHGLHPLLIENFTHQLDIISYLGVPGYLLGTILFIILSVNPGFPQWLRFSNLLVLQGVILAVFMVLPAPIGGYLKPTFINLGLAVFFFSTLLAPRN